MRRVVHLLLRDSSDKVAAYELLSIKNRRGTMRTTPFELVELTKWSVQLAGFNRIV